MHHHVAGQQINKESCIASLTMANVTPVTVYLVFYNTMQYVGWSFALLQCFTALQGSGGYANTYQQSGQTISTAC